MEGMAYGLVGGVLAIALIWSTVAVCLRFNAWLILAVFLIDFALLLTGSVVGFLIWQLCFFYGMARWEPFRGMYRLPKWPRMHLRGPGGRRRREFPEPMPWTRGPGSY